MRIEIDMSKPEDIRMMQEYIYFLQNKDKLEVKREDKKEDIKPQEAQPIEEAATPYQEYLKKIKEKEEKGKTKKGLFGKVKFKFE